MGYFKNTDLKLKELLGQNPTYQRSKYPGMQLGVAQNAFNARMPGSSQFQNNIFASQGNTLSNINRNATDASQALALGAAAQGQTDQALGNLQLQEADWKKFGLQNLNAAYGANTQEDQYMNENNQLNYQNKVQLEGAIAANKYAKRKALWNTVSGIGQFAVSAAGAIAGIPGLGGKGGGGGGTQTAGNPGNAGAQPSDIRLKENYFIVGKSKSGVDIYEFSYIGNPKRYRGVMAQDVPFASINVNGYLYVDYSKLDVDFKEI